jgi:predicted secreted protein
MKAVTLTAPSYPELRSLFLIRKLYVPKDIALTATQYSELCKRFSKGYERVKESPETQTIMKRVNRYINELENTGIGDHEVKKMDFTYSWMLRKIFIAFILFHIYLILCLPAFFILFPFSYLVQKKAEKERIAAKAKNPNKIEALDVVGSVKIVYSIIYMPFAMLLWVIFFYFSYGRYL